MAERALPHVTVRRNVRNQSGRGGIRPRLIVLHDTESHNRPGSADLRAIGDWFNNPAAQASAHACTDGEGNSARYVADEAKAWHVAGFNSFALGVEQIGFGSQGQWPDAQLRETARWLALWSVRWRIPLVRGRTTSVAGRAVVVRAGVVTHSSLGRVGGGHSDPGAHYPVDHVIRLAAHFKRLRGH